MGSRRIIFVTGTDTGVGKTVLTAMLTHHLRSEGVNALAMKPFCCGSRADVSLIQAMQAGHLSDGEVNPFYLPHPTAPWAASLRGRRGIHLHQVLNAIRRVGQKCEFLIVEGCGGLLVPLGEGYTAANVIAELGCDVLVVSRNKLGTINHTLLTVGAAIGLSGGWLKVVLMKLAAADFSARTNHVLLGKLIAPLPLLRFPFLGRNPGHQTAIKKNCKKIKKLLAQASR